MTKIYFKRDTSFYELYDYPCMGGFENYLTFSNLEGPFNKKPRKKKEEQLIDLEFDKMPEFFPITLWKYNLKMPSSRMDYTFWQEVNTSEILLTKENILSILDANKSYFKDNCFVKMEGVTDSGYPYFILNILGEEEKTREIINEHPVLSLIETLKKAYPVISDDIFYRKTIRRGFSTKKDLKFLHKENNTLENSKHLIF